MDKNKIAVFINQLEKGLDELGKELDKEYRPEQKNTLSAYSEQDEQKRLVEIVKYEKHQTYFYIKHQNELFGLNDRDVYYCYDWKKELKYEIKGDRWFGTHRLTVYKQGERIGRICRTLIPHPEFLEFEMGVRYSKVICDGIEMFRLRTHREAGELCCKIQRKYWRIQYRKREDIYSLKLKNEEIARIYKPFKSSQHANKNWVIGMNSKKYEADVILIAITIWNVIRK